MINNNIFPWCLYWISRWTAGLRQYVSTRPCPRKRIYQVCRNELKTNSIIINKYVRTCTERVLPPWSSSHTNPIRSRRDRGIPWTICICASDVFRRTNNNIVTLLNKLIQLNFPSPKHCRWLRDSIVRAKRFEFSWYCHPFSGKPNTQFTIHIISIQSTRNLIVKRELYFFFFT